MSTSLQDLRDLKSKIEEKKKSIAEQAKLEEQREKERLRKETASKTAERAMQLAQAEKKKKKTKRAFLIVAILAMSLALVVSIIRIVSLMRSDLPKDVILVSDGFETLAPGDATYAKTLD